MFLCFFKLDVFLFDFGNFCFNIIVEYVDRNFVLKRINWIELYVIDNLEVFLMVYYVGKNFGDVFLEGIYFVKYIFIDGSGNMVECLF